MLNSCLDIFEARMPSKTVGHDFGLLQAMDERIAMYGWLLNTGIKLVIVVDMEGRPAEPGRLTSALGLRNSDLTPVSIKARPISRGREEILTMFRRSKHCRRLTFACCEIHFMFLMSTTRSSRPSTEEPRWKSKALDSSKKSIESAPHGNLA